MPSHAMLGTNQSACGTAVYGAHFRDLEGSTICRYRVGLAEA